MKNIKIILIALSLFSLITCEASEVSKSPTFQKVGNYPHNANRQTEMIFSKDDKTLFVTKHNTIEILDLHDLAKPILLSKIVCSKKPKDDLYDFALSSDEKYLFASNYETLLVYDISNLHKIKIVNKLTVSGLTSLAITPDNKYLYLSGGPMYGTSSIQIYNVEDVKNISHIGTYEHDGYDLKVSPDGKILFYAIGSNRREVLGIADISNPKKPILLDETARHFHNRMSPFTSARFMQVLFSTDSKKLYIAGNEVGVMVYDISKNSLDNIQITAGKHWSMMFNSTNGVYSLALDREKNILYLAGIVHGETEQLIEGATEYTESIKGVEASVLIPGANIAVSNKGDFLVLQYAQGLDFYVIKQ